MNDTATRQPEKFFELVARVVRVTGPDGHHNDGACIMAQAWLVIRTVAEKSTHNLEIRGSTFNVQRSGLIYDL